jgi:hypothetical protein
MGNMCVHYAECGKYSHIDFSGEHGTPVACRKKTETGRMISYLVTYSSTPAQKNKKIIGHGRKCIQIEGFREE